MQTILSQQPNPTEPEKVGKTKSINFAGIIEAMYGALLLLLPIFFLPFTADAFNINKSYLVLFISVVSLILFFVQVWRKGSLHLQGIKSYLPGIVLLIAALVATVFSINRNVSLFGRYGNYNSSLIFILALMIMFFVSSNIKINLIRLVKYFLIGVTAGTAFAFIGFYNVTLPLFGNVVPGYSLVGSFNGLIGLQIIAVLAAMYMLFSRKDSKVLEKIIVIATLVINLTYLIIVMNWIGLAVIVLGVVYLYFTLDVDLKPLAKILGPVAFAIILLSLVHMLPATKSAMGINNTVVAPRLTLTQSWLVSSTALRDFPFYGTGLGSYVVDFSRYRPISLNATDYWNFRFAYPFNDIFLWMGTAGLIGIVSIVVFYVLVFLDAKNPNKENVNNYFSGFLASAILIILLLLGYNMILYVALFMMIGVLIQSKSVNTRVVQSSAIGIIGMVFGVLLLAGLIFQAYPKYKAQVSFRKAFSTTDAGQRYENIRSAIAADLDEDFYIREGIFTNLLIARSIAQKPEITDQERTNFQELVRQAINDARVVTEITDPFNVANWEARGIAYSAIMDISQGADQFAIAAYTNAINLEPTNPRLWVDLGGVYYRRQDYQNAVARFARAIQLKPDYANAYYNLAFALRDAGAYQAAVTQLEIVERLVPQDDPAYAVVQTNLTEFRELADKQAQALAEEQAKRAEELSKQVPPEPEPFPNRLEELEPPLENPEEEGEFDITNDGIEVPEDVVNPDAQLNQETAPEEGENTEVPADGTEVNEGEGETEAPIANPPAE